ncbi:GNAT family N-acetyltransferase [Streptomyces sp. SID14478]|uniref:GNAT family N-acetyltransferase n=1 Tax=Streptomyces sp. SID14478 TaxID=2706073 RepID=UPI0013DFCF6C|nr:GNAT family N-acetyltransferase [Streptomyces sp. SID14478]NEB81160.1 GNAT family N-acetyltransferase [Streptomyces sp. SID14478]
MNSPIDDAGPLLRDRTAGDLPACVAVLRQVHLADRYPTNWPVDPASWLSESAVEGAWVAERGGQVVGHVALARVSSGDVAPGLLAPGARALVVGRLFVGPAARGLRCGALLLERAAGEARRRGARAVLDVVTTDTAAVRLYERAGWEFLGAGQQDWGGGQLVDVRCYAAPPAHRTSR